MNDRNEGIDDFADSDFGDGALREAIGPIVMAGNVRAVPYEAILTAGRRRSRNRRICGAAAGVAVVAGTALAVPALAAGGPSAAKPAITAAGPMPSAVQSATVTPTATATPTAQFPPFIAHDVIPNLLAVHKAVGEAGRIYTIGSGTVAGHAWSVSVGIIDKQRTFVRSRPDLFPSEQDLYKDIPYAWTFFSQDGYQPVYSGNSDLVYNGVDKGLYLDFGPQSIIAPNSHGLNPAAVLFGKTNVSTVDHVGVVYAKHTDTLHPVVVQGHKFFVSTALSSDPPKEVITYDASGHVLQRDTTIGSVFAEVVGAPTSTSGADAPK